MRINSEKEFLICTHTTKSFNTEKSEIFSYNFQSYRASWYYQSFLPTDAQDNCFKKKSLIPNSATHIDQKGPNNTYMQPHHRINHTDVF